MKKKIFAGILVAVGLLVSSGTAQAAGIVCPNGQTAVKGPGGWYCQTDSGNGTGAGKTPGGVKK